MRKSISQLNMLSPDEYSQIVSSFNNTAVDYPKDKCVHMLFEEQVEKTPDKVAVIAYDRTLTYKELNEQANRIAHSLIEKGIGIGDIVAFMLPRRSYLLSVMFGILKSGAAYMPVDPNYPKDRINYMLCDSGAKICITEYGLLELLKNNNVSNPKVEMKSNNLCYCIYTSGSTGIPKAATVMHKNVVNFCFPNCKNHFTTRIINSCNIILASNAITFDIVLQEIYIPLLNGLYVLLTQNQEYIDDFSIDKLNCLNNCGLITTPIKMQLLLQNQDFCDLLQNFSLIMVGADVLTEKLIKDIKKLSNAEIINGYGPTETTCGVLYSGNL